MSNKDLDGSLQGAVDSQCSQNLDRNGSPTEPKSSRISSANAMLNTGTRRKHADSDSWADDVEVTSEFSSFIAKKLTEILDKRIKVADIEKANADCVQTEEKGGIKLFASSETVLKDAADDTSSIPKPRKKPDLLRKARKAKSARLKFAEDTEDEDDEEAKLASVVVTADWVGGSTDH